MRQIFVPKISSIQGFTVLDITDLQLLLYLHENEKSIPDVYLHHLLVPKYTLGTFHISFFTFLEEPYHVFDLKC